MKHVASNAVCGHRARALWAAAGRGGSHPHLPWRAGSGAARAVPCAVQEASEGRRSGSRG